MALTNILSGEYNIDSCSRGVSGALYLQSAIVGVMLCRGRILVRLPLESGVDTSGLAQLDSVNRVRSGTKQH